MNPRARLFLVASAAAAAAVWLAAELASGSYFWPGLFAVIALAGVLVHLLKIEADTILLGLVIFGYIVGNRGFAQFMPFPGLPLLPAEAALLVALGWRLVRSAFARRLPVEHDRLQWLILAWLVIGGVRFGFDLPRHGFLAARDFAVVYYALFFFIARHMAQDAAARRYLIGCVIAGCIVLTFTFPLSEAFPQLFTRWLRLGSTLFIVYKSDLVLSLIAAGSILVFEWATGARRYWAWPLASAMFFYTMVGDVRAVLVGGVSALLLLALARRWLFPLVQASLAAIGLLGLIAAAVFANHSWAGDKLAELGAQAGSVISVARPGSDFAPKSYKLDNNRFRLVWWRSVATEVWDTNPIFGLGFGHDLAAGFLAEYDQDLGDDFVTRSPHCIAVTALGRMGLVGAVLWTAFCAVLLTRFWRALRDRATAPVDIGLWCCLWVLLVSATFGVVLEGPMGAVVFWTILGLLYPAPAGPAGDAESSPDAAAPLPSAAETASAVTQP